MVCTLIFLQRLNFLRRENIISTGNFFNLQRFADGEKTEQPTDKKRSDARNKGQVARSQELNAAFVMLGGFIGLNILWEYVYKNIAGYSAHIFSNLATTATTESIYEIIIGVITLLSKTAFPIMLGIMVFGLAVNIYQVGFKISTYAISFRPEKLNPINGFGRFFSKRALVELIKSLIKIIVIGFFLYLYLKDEIPFMPYFIYYDLTRSLAEMADKIFVMTFQILGVIMVLAIADYAYQKWQMTQDLMMTKQEVKDEYKQAEGDPKIKAKIKQKQREMAMARMMQEVPKADVIVTNPTHLAVALRYEAGMTAPMVIAKGKDIVAERIKEIARENRIMIVENKPLARALYEAVEVGGDVPQELYQAVAELLAYVYRLKKKKIRPANAA